MSSRRLVLALAALAVCGVIWVAVLIGFLLANTELMPPGIAVTIAAALVVPGFLAAIVTNISAIPTPTTVNRWLPPTTVERWLPSATLRARRGPRELFRPLPRPLRWSCAVLFYGFILSGATAFIGIGGNADIVNGQYVLDNHGTITVVNKATWNHQLAQQDRIALSAFGAFGVAGAALCLVSVFRSRVGSRNGDQRSA
jgi:hypothetical protein